MTLDEGYEAFDIDGKQRITLTNIHEAAEILHLEISKADLYEMFLGLDVANEGFIRKEEWIRRLTDADGCQVCVFVCIRAAVRVKDWLIMIGPV